MLPVTNRTAFVLHIPKSACSTGRALTTTSKAKTATGTISMSSFEASPSHHSISRRTLLHFLALLPANVSHSAQAAADYDRFAATYEVLDGSTTLTRAVGFDTLRAAALSRAHGDVLELCVGTGVNLPLYNTATVTSVTGLDASRAMLSRATARARALRFGDAQTAWFVLGDAAATGLPTAAFDTVVATFALCVVDRPADVLREMRRVVASHGTVVVVDYSLSARNRALAAYQRAVGPLVAMLSKGCAPNRDVPALAADAGLREIWRQEGLGGSVVALQFEPV